MAQGLNLDFLNQPDSWGDEEQDSLDLGFLDAPDTWDNLDGTARANEEVINPYQGEDMSNIERVGSRVYQMQRQGVAGIGGIIARQQNVDKTTTDFMTDVARNLAERSDGDELSLLNFGALPQAIISETADYLIGGAAEGYRKMYAALSGQGDEQVKKTLIDTEQRVRAEAQKALGSKELQYTGNGVQKFGWEVAEGITNMAPAIVAGWATRNPGVSLGIIGQQVAGNTYADYMAETGDHDRAIAAAKFNVMAEVLPEALPVMAILRKAKAGEATARFLEASLGEGAQEALTEILQSTYDAQELEGMTLQEAIRGIDWSQVGKAALLGIGVGGGLAIPGTIADLRAKEQSAPPPDQNSSPPEVFNPTHNAGGGIPVQPATKNGQVIPDTYVTQDGRVIRDPNAVQVQNYDNEFDVDAQSERIKNEVDAGSGIISSAMETQSIPIEEIEMQGGVDVGMETTAMPIEEIDITEPMQGPAFDPNALPEEQIDILPPATPAEEVGVTEVTMETEQERDAAEMEVVPPDDQDDDVPRGTSSEVVTSNGERVQTQFKLVEADQLVTSNDDAGNPNPAYPQELQPRDRSRTASQAQVADIANNLEPSWLGESPQAETGAPIVGADNVVESGNARSMAVRRAYSTNNGEAYRQYLRENAAAFGLTEAQIDAMQNPVLVRERQGEADLNARAEFARQANQSNVAPMSPVETATSDAARITDEDMQLYTPSADGNVLADSNQSFLQRFAQSIGDLATGGMSTSDGRWTKQMADRVRSAVFWKAYQNEQILNLQAEESDPDIKNILNALDVAAPAFARARSVRGELGELDVVSDIISAIDLLRQAKANGTTVSQLASQQGMFGNVDPLVADLAMFIENNNRSAKRMGIALNEMATFLESEMKNLEQDSLFDMQPATKDQLIQAANQRLQEIYGDETTIERVFSEPESRQETAEVDTGSRDSDGQQRESDGATTETQTTEREAAAEVQDEVVGETELDFVPEDVFTPEQLAELEAMDDVPYDIDTLDDMPPLPPLEDDQNFQYSKEVNERSPEQQAFMEDVSSRTTVHPFDNRSVILMNRDQNNGEDFAILELRAMGNHIYVSAIQSSRPGKGNGSYALNFLTQLADKHGLELHGNAVPFGLETLDQQQLLDWYGRYGFKQIAADRIVRAPNTEMAFSREEQTDMFGDVNETQQQVEDERRRRDQKRSPEGPRPAEAQAEDDLFANDGQLPPDLFANRDIYAALDEVDISYDVFVEDQQRNVTVTENAGQAMRNMDNRIEALEQLRACVQ